MWEQEHLETRLGCSRDWPSLLLLSSLLRGLSKLLGAKFMSPVYHLSQSASTGVTWFRMISLASLKGKVFVSPHSNPETPISKLLAYIPFVSPATQWHLGTANPCLQERSISKVQLRMLGHPQHAARSSQGPILASTHSSMETTGPVTVSGPFNE